MQISANLTDLDVTMPHVLFEEAKKDASAMRVCVSGCELVGLIPLRALLAAADFYCAKDGLLVLEEQHKVE